MQHHHNNTITTTPPQQHHQCNTITTTPSQQHHHNNSNPTSEISGYQVSRPCARDNGQFGAGACNLQRQIRAALAQTHTHNTLITEIPRVAEVSRMDHGALNDDDDDDDDDDG